MVNVYDVIIIGAGVSGCACARELSKFNANVLVIDKEEDLCCGTTKANSAIVHAGFDAATGSLKAKLNVEGSKMMPQLAKDLDIPYLQNGSLVCCTDEERLDALDDLLQRGKANGVQGLQILSREELKEKEPNISDNVLAALFAPTGAIIDPFILNIALAENANQNGVDFKFNTEAKDIKKTDDEWIVSTTEADLRAKCIVNAAGVYADKIHNMACDSKINITALRGDYLLLDKTAGGHVSSTIFMLPGKFGKGVLVTPTVHGNLLVGPTSIPVSNKEGTNTAQDGLNMVIDKSAQSVQNIPLREVITSFAGLRAHEDNDDFIVGEDESAPGFIDCAGIESPGLSSAPAIGAMVAKIVSDKMHFEKNQNFINTRKGILDPSTLDIEQRSNLIKEKPEYGQIICRCEGVSEGEVVDSINRPLGAKSLDGVKRRVRAGMGRCQSGFCSPRVLEILARETGRNIEDITKSGGSSKIIIGKNKE